MSMQFFLKTAVTLASASFLGLAQAQTTPIKFQLDWRLEGPKALFLTTVAKAIPQMAIWTRALTPATPMTR